VVAGHFRDHRYIHPTFGFELEFPASWPIDDTPAGAQTDASADYMDATVTRSGTHTEPSDVEVSFFVDVEPEPGLMEMPAEPDLEVLAERRVQVPPANVTVADTTFRYEGWVPGARKRRVVVEGEGLALIVMITYNEADAGVTDGLVTAMRVR